MSDSAHPVDPQALAEEVEASVAAKREARRAARAIRAACHTAAADAAEQLAGRVRDLVAQLSPSGPAMVAGYWPKGDELDLRPTLEMLALAGHGVCLPVVSGVAWPLLFRFWRPGHPLVPGSFRIMEPMADAPLAQPSIVLVPLLAFDKDGWRLGYGGGFYDRTLAVLRDSAPVVAVGIAYAGQEVPSVPRDPYDQRLDWLVTEKGVSRFAPTQS
ncbi:5-formyltetrahydrofolate cyclo-ligase [Niveispirillum sp. SYP-B3756]|uniref:5-formyltetrahydrofolate cyclo-ligase n=1 Tax=Niveispirillum sp. SYP-B3756 TaxID=2662178 RepID=UPI001290E387|nr:5-formyltetrahydrofolate cyclo-ligase [Niveispirillum sp. SYP-B3756]MQP63762.1 5-formyltetrahydrofolate cyclo-ligase [Niveispirillum sp. SYP-B3756]